MPALKTLWSREIRDARSLTRYVARTTALSAGLALALDVVNQLVFFAGWEGALRSWLVTVLVAGGIALAASRSIRRAQLALWRAKAEVEHLSRTDPLTGLLNRRALFADLDPVVDTMTLVIADLDHFKRVNDTHGHLVGDEVIRTVSGLLDRHLGDLGRVGRLGGEEFAFLSSAVPLPLLMARLHALRDALEATPMAMDRVTVTVSAGVAVRRRHQSFEALYAAADRALYAAKASGRNRIVVDDAEDGGVAPKDEPVLAARASLPHAALRAVLRRIGLSNGVAMRQGPGAERLEGGAQRVSQWRDGVFDADRCRGQDGPRHEPVPFQPLEGIGQSLVGDAVEPPLDGVEARRFRAQNGQDHDRPLVGDLVQHGANAGHVGESALGQRLEVGIVRHI
jgi:diguanylate cyclase (GGDEF)-like protein